MSEQFKGLRLRIRADKSGGIVHKMRDGESITVNPHPGRPWPASGVDCLNPEGWPVNVRISQNKLQELEDKGVVDIEGKSIVVCPAGPPDNPWRGSAVTRKNHEFVQGDTVCFHCDCANHDHDVKYTVTKNPGKYYESDGALVTKETIDRYGEPAEVVWTYELQRVS